MASAHDFLSYPPRPAEGMASPSPCATAFYETDAAHASLESPVPPCRPAFDSVVGQRPEELYANPSLGPGCYGVPRSAADWRREEGAVSPSASFLTGKQGISRVVQQQRLLRGVDGPPPAPVQGPGMYHTPALAALTRSVSPERRARNESRKGSAAFLSPTRRTDHANLWQARGTPDAHFSMSEEARHWLRGPNVCRPSMVCARLLKLSAEPARG
jgi:hypothetical protein